MTLDLSRRVPLPTRLGVHRAAWVLGAGAVLTQITFPLTGGGTTALTVLAVVLFAGASVAHAGAVRGPRAAAALVLAGWQLWRSVRIGDDVAVADSLLVRATALAVAVAIVLGSAISLAYYLRVVAAVWMSAPEEARGSSRVVAPGTARPAIAGGSQEADEVLDTRRSGAGIGWITAVAVVCAIATIAIGVVTPSKPARSPTKGPSPSRGSRTNRAFTPRGSVGSDAVGAITITTSGHSSATRRTT